MNKKKLFWIAGTPLALPGIALASILPTVISQSTDATKLTAASDTAQLQSAIETELTQSELNQLELPPGTSFTPALLGLDGLQLSGKSNIFVEKKRGENNVSYTVTGVSYNKTTNVTFQIFGMEKAFDPAMALDDATSKLKAASATALHRKDFSALTADPALSTRETIRSLGLGELLINPAVRIGYKISENGSKISYELKVRQLVAQFDVAIRSQADAKSMQLFKNALAELTTTPLTENELLKLVIVAGTPFDPAALGILAPTFPADLTITTEKAGGSKKITYSLSYAGLSGTQETEIVNAGATNARLLIGKIFSSLELVKKSTLTERQFISTSTSTALPLSYFGVETPAGLGGVSLYVNNKRGLWTDWRNTYKLDLTYSGRSISGPASMEIDEFAPPPLEDDQALTKTVIRQSFATTMTRTAYTALDIPSGTPLEKPIDGILFPAFAQGKGITLLKRAGTQELYCWFYKFGAPYDLLVIVPASYADETVTN